MSELGYVKAFQEFHKVTVKIILLSKKGRPLTVGGYFVITEKYKRLLVNSSERELKAPRYNAFQEAALDLVRDGPRY